MATMKKRERKDPIEKFFEKRQHHYERNRKLPTKKELIKILEEELNKADSVMDINPDVMLHQAHCDPENETERLYYYYGRYEALRMVLDQIDRTFQRRQGEKVRERLIERLKK